MSMNLMERMGRLVRADAHGMLEQLEERSLLLKQHLREAEIELNHKRAELDSLDEEQRRLADERSRLQERIHALDEDVELALAGEKEELARFAIRRLLPRRGACAQVEARIEELATRRQRLAGRLETQARQFDELRTRVRAELAAARTRADHDAPFTSDDVVADEEVELELLRRRGALVTEDAR